MLGSRDTGLARSARAALGLLLPPRCLKCGAMVGEPAALCARCWSGLTFLEPPLCAVCGVPFGFDPGEGAVCGACARGPRAYRQARSVLRYDEACRGLIISFKHGDRTDAAPAYAAWLARAGAEMISRADAVAPVPLHRSRLVARRYNQAALLARELARDGDIAYLPDALARIRRTPSQGGLGRLGRERNVRGAFRVPQSRRPVVEGRRILLIDDVMTTGATVSACARALRRAGAAAVDVLTLARVIQPEG